MKTKKQLLILLLTIFTATSLNFSALNNAQAQGGIFAGPTGNEIVCRTGESDWETFISSVISYDDFNEYWKDILVRYNTNMCLYSDIDNLSQQITKVQKQIRLSFSTCSPNSAKLKDTYYRLEAELFFLRKYIEPSNGKLVVKPDAEVYAQLRSHFVFNKNFFSEEVVKSLFDQFKAKYADRLTTYQNCSDATWTNLIAKWNQLKENVENGFGAEQIAENLKRKMEKVTNAPLERTGNLLWGLLDVRLNDIEPEMALPEILKELERNTPDGITFDELRAAQNAEQQRYQNDFEKADYLGQYELLYKESSGESITNITDRLKALETTISTSNRHINQTYNCTKGLLDRAC